MHYYEVPNFHEYPDVKKFVNTPGYLTRQRFNKVLDIFNGISKEYPQCIEYVGNILKDKITFVYETDDYKQNITVHIKVTLTYGLHNFSFTIIKEDSVEPFESNYYFSYSFIGELRVYDKNESKYTSKASGQILPIYELLDIVYDDIVKPKLSSFNKDNIIKQIESKYNLYICKLLEDRKFMTLNQLWFDYHLNTMKYVPKSLERKIIIDKIKTGLDNNIVHHFNPLTDPETDDYYKTYKLDRYEIDSFVNFISELNYIKNVGNSQFLFE